ncbi:MAG: sensor histidine kinase [Thermoplasmatales archaeon]|nr:sensor histidine kinase [Thermoplasmatales archaeon]
MSNEFPKSIQLKIDEIRYWEGLGRQEMDFHQVLGELMDNSISASGKDVDGDLLPCTVEILIQRIGSRIRVKVADQGVGMTIDELTKYVLSPGGKGSSNGPLNEHGFGLKNALCMLTSGNKFPFRIQTRDDEAVRTTLYYVVKGPFSLDMKVELDNADTWNVNIKHSSDDRGTRVFAETTYEYFNTLYRRARNFETLIERLGEHLGVMYRSYLKNTSNKIWLRWQDLGEDEDNPDSSAEWNEKRCVPIEIPYDIEGCTERTIEVIHSSKKALVSYREGNLDKGNVDDASKGWPYPLKIYYQANIPTQGIDIVVRNRIVKTCQLPEIWLERQRHNDYNYFTGELILDDNFRTVNNKTAIDPHNPFWKYLIETLNEESKDYTPAKRTRKKTERDIKEKMKTILEGAVSGSSVHLDRPVWSGSGVKIDLYHKMSDGKKQIYEVKPDTAEPIDVYQLLMYWDGLVKDEGASPILARLVAKDAPGSVTNMIDEINKRKDNLSNQYNFEFKKIEDMGIR